MVLKHPFPEGKAKTFPGVSSRGARESGWEVEEADKCIFIPEAMREGKYFLCASVSLLEM